MIGFMQIIDALGGVTVNLSTTVRPGPQRRRRGRSEAPSVGPGPVTMNGPMALSFVRTREQDSDYSRMKRQRCLLAAVAAGTSPTDLAVNYLGLAAAVEGAFRSDIAREQLGDLVRVFSLVDGQPGPHTGAGATGDQAVGPRHRPHPDAGGQHARRRRSSG